MWLLAVGFRTDSLFTGSKSDGQRSPNDTVFLHMDEIPYIHEDKPENPGEDGECSQMNPGLTSQSKLITYL